MADWDLTKDVVIVGSGGGAMVGSLVAKDAGFDVLVVEKTEYVGGSTAMSGGGVWIPNNPLMKAEGVHDSEEDALEYFESVVGDVGPASSLERRKAYVQNAPRMISYLQELGVEFQRCDGWPDYYSEYPGASKRGRTIECPPFDMNQLGPWKAKLRPGMTIGLGMPANTSELMPMSYWNRGLRPFLISARVMLRKWTSNARGKALVCSGMSLIGRILKVAVDKGVVIWTEAPFVDLVVEDGRVTGVVVSHEGKEKRIAARHGVLLAAGGFSHNPEMREKYFGYRQMATWSGANPGDTGEVMQAAMDAGAATALLDQAIWNIVLFMPDGSRPPYKPTATAGLSRARNRPGTIIVDPTGSRFVNETASYMEVGSRMVERKCVPGWLIFDDASRRRYILGRIPGRLPDEWIKDGFVKRADTIEGLARQCGIPPENLRATLDTFNEGARRGVDTQFHRGEAAYDQFLGDAYHKPNKSIAPMEKPPFYAMAAFPSDVGTFGGLLTDERSRVLREDGQPIPGLYAAGNNTAGICGKHYIGAGASIGPTCTWGYIAVHDIADQAKKAPASVS